MMKCIAVFCATAWMCAGVSCSAPSKPASEGEAAHEHGHSPAAHEGSPQTGGQSGVEKEKPKTAVVPYPLDSCIVSGEKLGSMGDPIVKVYDGREVRFCCSGCVKKFEADKAGYLAKIDAKAGSGKH
jgi:hypothetical protein